MPGLILRIDPPSAEIRIDEPGTRNALNRAMWRDFPLLAAQVKARRDVRALVVRGANGDFASGADISEFDEAFSSPSATADYLDDMVAATGALAALPIPVVAVIEGLCIGAGVAVALACDIRLAAADARFAITPAKLGLIYSLTDTLRLVAAVGPSAAKSLLFSGRMVDAPAALRLRLIDEVPPSDELESLARDRVSELCDRSSTSIAGAKQIIRLIADGQTEENPASRDLFADAPQGADFVEGLAAFRDRRRPRFPPR